MSDDKELNIDSDKYKYECCSITQEECNEWSCQKCEVAIDEAVEIEVSENIDFCTFESRSENGVTLEMNLHNTVAKCKSVEDFFTYIGDRADFNKYEKLTGVLNHVVMDKEYPNYKTIIEELKTKTCTESYYLQDYPYIAVHGVVVLVIAPRIYSD